MNTEKPLPNLNFIDPDARPWDSEGVKAQRARQKDEDVPSVDVDFAAIMSNKEAYFSRQQIADILNHCFSKKQHARFYLFLTLYRTGRRITEIVGKPPYGHFDLRCESEYKGLRPCDFRHKQRAIEFDILKKSHIKKRTQGGVRRTDEVLKKMRLRKKPKRQMIAIDQELWDHLQYYCDRYVADRQDRLFPISRFTAHRWLQQTCKEAGVKMELGTRKIRRKGEDSKTILRQPHLHMFRHSFAIHVLEGNAEDPTALPKLKDLLAHSTLEITSHYLQFSQQSTRDFLDKTWGVKDEDNT